MKTKATTQVKATARVKAAMKLKTQGPGHLTFLIIFLEGEGLNNFLRVYIRYNLVTAGGSLRPNSFRREDSLTGQGRILK